MNAPGTFIGLLAHTDPQKVSDLHGERNRLLSAEEAAEKTRWAKGAGAALKRAG